MAAQTGHWTSWTSTSFWQLSEDSDADIVEPPPVLAPVADAAPDFPVDDPPPLPPPLEPPPPVLLHPLPWYSCYLANGGKLSWYLRQCKWEATCKNPAHGKCVVTRSGGLKESNLWGRPLGLLSAFLINNNQPTTAAHMAYLADLYSAAGHATRIEARAIVRGLPSVAPLF